MYAYDFEGRRYDVGDKLGFLQATVEYALRKEELKDNFMDYLSKRVTSFLVPLNDARGYQNFPETSLCESIDFVSVLR